jgi:hypothetical protein
MNKNESTYFIKFDDQYPKLHGQTVAQLLSVREVGSQELCPEFLTYDTTLADGTRRIMSNTYPKMVLTFLGNKHIPFSTLRTIHSVEEFAFYENALGDYFDIIIEE